MTQRRTGDGRRHECAYSGDPGCSAPTFSNGYRQVQSRPPVGTRRYVSPTTASGYRAWRSDEVKEEVTGASENNNTSSYPRRLIVEELQLIDRTPPGMTSETSPSSHEHSQQTVST